MQARRLVPTLIAASVIASGLLGLVSMPAGASPRPPSIVKATMVAAKGSKQVDAVELTYSSAIKHKVQKAGPFPFTVEGYTVTSVGATSTKTSKDKELELTLEKLTTSDLTATPFITYVPPSKDPVESKRGVKAAAQRFIGTGAASPASAIYVATIGSDANPGTKAKPLATIQAAITLAASRSPIPNLYVGAGTYVGTVALSSHVGIDGGYSSTWSRSLTAKTVIAGEPMAAYADDATGVTLQLLALQATAAASGSTYGLQAVDSSVSLQDVTVQAGDADGGVAGANGSTGASGDNGENGASGGAGGVGAAGNSGGAGGTSVIGAVDGLSGANGSGAAPGEGGEGGTPPSPLCSPTAAGSAPSDATSGAPGANGENGATSPSTAGITWNQAYGSSGTNGTVGSGGGGGGSGAGGVSDVFACLSGSGVSSGAGGGGGAGGAAGIRGSGGQNGGGSFGIYLDDSAVTVDAECSVSAGAGGNGGAGGSGGLGGGFGVGGAGQAGDPPNSGNGASGAAGGAGGAAGSGAGGDGGPSIGIAEVDGSTAVLASGAAISVAGGGLGGAGGTNAQLGAAPTGTPGATAMSESF